MLHDLVIAGAGPVGATLALAVADADLDVVVVDARPEGGTLRGDRSLALSHGARLVLERLGVWTPLAAQPGAVTPIVDIDISQARGFGSARLTAADAGLPALGYVVRYLALQRSLDAALARRGIGVRWGTRVGGVGGTPAYAAVDVEGAADPLLARLAVVADGAGAVVAGLERRRHDYGESALVASVWVDGAPPGLAFERFTIDGPVALLPEGDHHGLVWTAKPGRAAELLALDDAAFLARLAGHFGPRAGRFVRVADRRSFPLVLEFVPRPAASRTVVIGNAAQTLHPVAGQGFNVGLRDAFELSRVIVATPRDALGERAMLDRYASRRRSDRVAGIAFTHGLVTLFGADHAVLRWPRGVGLALLDVMPAAKRAFTRTMLFGLR